jgi:hypothetical protein
MDSDPYIIAFTAYFMDSFVHLQYLCVYICLRKLLKQVNFKLKLNMQILRSETSKIILCSLHISWISKEKST